MNKTISPQQAAITIAPITKDVPITVIDPIDKHALETPNSIAAEWHGALMTYGHLRKASLKTALALRCSLGTENDIFL